MKYKPTIGLEVHAELKTKTKMFCSCKNDPDEKIPNKNVCPVCMGHPGTLPVVNKEAVRNVLKVGIAIGGNLADESEFDRKNYFYPDIPKGYQISQYKYPLVSGGELCGVKITRIHLEEDTAKSSHENKEFSLVDFNRAGVPLMELVTEPVMHSAEDVVNFGQELQLLLQYLGVAYANMEKGEMRLEANISISDSDVFGTKVEVKNLNSFKSAERAIEYEIQRQAKVLESGAKVMQETRGWDESKQETFSQRSKEDSHDYRYFPDPDIPKLKISKISDFDMDLLKKDMAEIPSEKRKRFKEKYLIKESDIEFFINNRNFSDLFEKSASYLKNGSYQTLSNFIISEISGRENGLLVESSSLANLINMFESGLISSRGMKDILAVMLKDGGSPEEIAKKEGLLQKNDEGELEDMAKNVLEQNKNVVAQYKNGKDSALQFLVGQCMKLSKGSANPQKIKEIIIKLLK